MKIIAANKRASYDYLINEEIEAGIVLTGSEVKSLRINTGSLRGSFILEKDGEFWLSNSFIKNYNNSSDKNYNPNRDRKLLLSKRQFNKIFGAVKVGKFSIIPMSMYFTNKGLVKLLFGVGKGKKKYDKRQTIKEKDWNIKKKRILINN